MTIKELDGCNGSEIKPKRRRVRVGDPDFVPPDGGWGWMIVVACGFSNVSSINTLHNSTYPTNAILFQLSTFPMFQQFGLVFREKFEALNISNAQTTTVININSAFNTCVGGCVREKENYFDCVNCEKVKVYCGYIFRTFKWTCV